MLEPFVSPTLLIERATQHLAELKAWNLAYLSSGPGQLISEHNPETNRTHHKLRVTRQPPPIMSAITFDLINCLRSSLDHTVYDATALISGNATPANTKFPFGKDEAGNRSGRAKAVPERLRLFIANEFRPYKPEDGGDEALSGLNDLRNQKIHRLLSTFAFQRGGIGVNQFFGGAGGDVTITSLWDREKQEFTYAITEAPEIGHIQANLAIEIGFDQPPAFDGKPFIEVLTKLVMRVHTVVQGITAETSRIKADPSD